LASAGFVAVQADGSQITAVEGLETDIDIYVVSTAE